MKPKTKVEREVTALGEALPDLNPRQRRWMTANTMEHHIFYTKKTAWCSHCGGSFELADLKDGKVVRCPHCGQKFTAQHSQRKTFSENGYSLIITTIGGWQVLRYFCVELVSGRSDSPKLDNGCIYEVLRIWYKGGKVVKQGIPLREFANYRKIPYSWDRRHDMSIVKDNPNPYGNNWREEWMIVHPYPYGRILPEYKKYGISVKMADNLCGYDKIFQYVPTDPFAETLLKKREWGLLSEELYRPQNIGKFAPSVKVALRHGYDFSKVKVRDYIDYLRPLEELGLDLRSPHYLCPAGLANAHRIMSARIDRKREQEREQERKKDAAMVAKKMAGWAGFSLADGKLVITPLMTLQDFADEGKAMHHCVYANEYYKEPHCLIMSARYDGKRAETIEVDTKDYTIVQSRAVCNGKSQYHQQILDLVNGNMRAIRRRARACNYA
jgi:ribosomal protein S27AE